ncbi:MAG: class C sortase [Eubacteriaceae bacterium]|jgi:sortase A
MKRIVNTKTLVVIFLIGLSVLLYPPVSSYYNSFHQSRAVSDYENAVAGLSEADYKEMIASAQDYNQSLIGNSYRFEPDEQEEAAYQSLLNPDGTGVMGYIEIPKIRVSIPVYHGTDDAVLSAGVGHIEGTSLPVGGTGTHCALSGHRGLPSSKLFTDLDQLEIGDTFKITVLNETLTYKVDQIKIVLPDDTSDLGIDPDQDYVTLLTCTPYTINTHRLLVRGVRTEDENTSTVTAEAVQIDPLIIAGILTVSVLILLMTVFIVQTSEKYMKHH